MSGLKSLIALGVALVWCAGSLAGDDPVGRKLEGAEWAFIRTTEEHQTEVAQWFSKREEAARKDGNKKLVDQIKVERQTFEARQELPKSAPSALKQRLPAARATLQAAYVSAVRAYTKAGNDAEAANIELRLSEFIAADCQRRRWVHDKGEFRQIQLGVWAEKSPDGKIYSFREVARNKDFIEIDALDGNTATRVRLSDSSADYGYKPKLSFGTGYVGKWER